MCSVFCVIISSFLLLANSAGGNNCNKLGTLFYEQLGCSAVYHNQTCPSSYQCRKVEAKYCYFKGRQYKTSESLQYEDMRPIHYDYCRCIDKPGDMSEFQCVIKDCLEYFEDWKPDKCFYKFNPSYVCATGHICPPIKTFCEVDGVRYREGQRFKPKGTCKSCVCSKDFDGTYKPPYCVRRSCSSILSADIVLKKNCAPVYNTNSDNDMLCCPDNYVCASDFEKIVIQEGKMQLKSNDTCLFGKRKIKLSDRFSGHPEWNNEITIKCTCILPPFMTCVMKN